MTNERMAKDERKPNKEALQKPPFKAYGAESIFGQTRDFDQQKVCSLNGRLLVTLSQGAPLRFDADSSPRAARFVAQIMWTRPGSG